MLALCTLVWLLLCAWLFWYCRRRQAVSVGLPLAYVALLSIAHCGAAVYLLPWYDPSWDGAGFRREYTIDGTAATTLGLAAFCLGVWLSEGLLFVRRAPRQVLPRLAQMTGLNLVIFGVASFVLVVKGPSIPGAGSMATAGANLVVVGICLRALSQLRSATASKARLIAGTLSIPLITVASVGFFGYGVTALVQVGSFFVRLVRVRWWHVAAAPVLLWLGLSAYVTYMHARGEIRKQVWSGSGWAARVKTLANVLASAQPFDPRDAAHLHAIDDRLNQNVLAGQAIRFMDAAKKEPAYGRTLAIAAIAWIPRALWPGKPEFAGSGNLAAEFTGQTFSRGTSVGVGHVLELYINFLMPGVGLGFFIFGAIIRYLDVRAAEALLSGRSWDYIFYHLVGLSALQPGGMWAESVGSCAAAALLVAVLRRTGFRP